MVPLLTPTENCMGGVDGGWSGRGEGLSRWVRGWVGGENVRSDTERSGYFLNLIEKQLAGDLTLFFKAVVIRLKSWCTDCTLRPKTCIITIIIIIIIDRFSIAIFCCRADSLCSCRMWFWMREKVLNIHPSGVLTVLDGVLVLASLPYMARETMAAVWGHVLCTPYKRDLGSNLLWLPFLFKVVVCGHCPVTLSLAINKTLKWLSSLPILMQVSFWLWQCSNRYIISLSPPLISLVVSVGVKHHIYLLTTSIPPSPHP